MFLTTLIDGRRETREIADGAYLIGRGEGCRIRLNAPDVSERHAVMTVRDGRAVIEDLHSANGTFVNDTPVDRAFVLDGGKVVRVGSCLMRVSDRAAEDASAAVVVDAPPPQAESGDGPEDGAAEGGDPLREIRRNAQTQIQVELLKRMDLKKLTMQGVDKAGLEEIAREKIHAIIDEVTGNGRLPPGLDPVRLEEDVFNEAMRLGPLEGLLDDDSVTEIMVNGPEKVYVERNGKLQLADCQFADDASVQAVVERIVAPL